MKVLMIQPGKTAYKTEISQDLKPMQEAVGGSIECVYPYDDAVAIVCNEEGKINGLSLNRAIYGEDGQMIDIIAGNFFVAGIGEDSFTDLPEDLMDKYMKMFYSPEKFIRVNGEIIVEKMPIEIARTKERITKLSADVQLATSHPNPQEGMSPMTINGTVYTERVPAGEKLISICKGLSAGEHQDIGAYRGFHLSLSYVDSEFYLDITNKLVHVVTLGADPLGNIRRVENELNGLETDLQSAADYLTDLNKQLAIANKEVKKEFQHEQLLAEKTEKLGKLNALLAADAKHLEDTSTVDPVPESQTMEVTMF